MSLSNFPPGVTASMIPGYNDRDISYSVYAAITYDIEDADIKEHQLITENKLIKFVLNKINQNYIKVTYDPTIENTDESIVVPDDNSKVNDYITVKFNVTVEGDTTTGYTLYDDEIINDIINDIYEKLNPYGFDDEDVSIDRDNIEIDFLN